MARVAWWKTGGRAAWTAARWALGIDFVMEVGGVLGSAQQLQYRVTQNPIPLGANAAIVVLLFAVQWSLPGLVCLAIAGEHHHARALRSLPSLGAAPGAWWSEFRLSTLRALPARLADLLYPTEAGRPDSVGDQRVHTWWWLARGWVVAHLVWIPFRLVFSSLLLTNTALLALSLWSAAAEGMTVWLMHRAEGARDRAPGAEAVRAPLSTTPSTDLPSRVSHEIGACVVCGAVDAARRCTRCGAARAAGSFTVVGVLGSTPGSRTYLAMDPAGAEVALKEKSIATVTDAAALDGMAREAELLAQVHHPQVPRVVASFTEGEGPALRFYLAQEYVRGRSLAEEMATRGRMPEVLVEGMLRSLLEVLRHLHGHEPSLIHRDVKPANIMRRPDGLLVLIDFGVARALEDTHHDGTLVGTFGYMPPQQLAGAVDRTSDLYALGATALHLLTGRPPWEFYDEDLRLPRAHTLGVSRRLGAVLDRLLARRRADRFSSASEVLSALGAPGHLKRARGATSTMRAMAIVVITLSALGMLPQVLMLYGHFHPPPIERFAFTMPCQAGVEEAMTEEAIGDVLDGPPTYIHVTRWTWPHRDAQRGRTAHVALGFVSVSPYPRMLEYRQEADVIARFSKTSARVYGGLVDGFPAWQQHLVFGAASERRRVIAMPDAVVGVTVRFDEPPFDEAIAAAIFASLRLNSTMTPIFFEQLPGAENLGCEDFRSEASLGVVPCTFPDRPLPAGP